MCINESDSSTEQPRKPWFPFSSLPMDLRRLVYSKMCVKEGIQLIKASTEASEFYSRKPNRIKFESLVMYVSELSGTATISMMYGRDLIERFILSSEMTAVLSTELESYKSCSCRWCKDWEQMAFKMSGYFGAPKVQIEDIPTVTHQWKSMERVMYPLQFLIPSRVYIRCFPYGGLIETISPPFPLIYGHALEVYWHAGREEPPRSLNVEMWNKWLGYVDGEGTVRNFSPSSRYFTIRLLDVLNYSVSDDVFSLNAAKHAGSLTIEGQITANISQLMSLRACSLVLPFAEVSAEDALVFYQNKVMEWVRNPSAQLYYEVPGLEFCSKKLLKYIVHDLLCVRPDVFYYSNYRHDNWGFTEYDGSHQSRCMTLRSLKSNSVVFVSGTQMISSGNLDKDNIYARWPLPSPLHFI